jgi:hypothetical protein
MTSGDDARADDDEARIVDGQSEIVGKSAISWRVIDERLERDLKKSAPNAARSRRSLDGDFGEAERASP